MIIIISSLVCLKLFSIPSTFIGQVVKIIIEYKSYIFAPYITQLKDFSSISTLLTLYCIIVYVVFWYFLVRTNQRSNNTITNLHNTLEAASYDLKHYISNIINLQKMRPASVYRIPIVYVYARIVCVVFDLFVCRQSTFRPLWMGFKKHNPK